MEERILYFDIVNGISGDMTIASLLNLGVPKEIFLEEMSKLNLKDEFSIEISQKNESGIVGTNVNVVAKEGHAHRHLVDVFDIIEKKIHCIKLQMSRIRLIYCKQICTLYFYVRKIATL